jgi:ABC-type multidrug transport system fused ATPase/permease subunit
LHDISFSIQADTLLGVVGQIGAGKSSLLMALIGEMPSIQGNITTNGRIFYVSQEPWIFSATIKQNILFGKPYDRDKLNEIIKICALRQVVRFFSCFS